MSVADCQVQERARRSMSESSSHGCAQDKYPWTLLPFGPEPRQLSKSTLIDREKLSLKSLTG
jgi:hypothetical protein